MMNRILLFCSALLVLVSCGPRSIGKKLVLNYLKENTDGVEYSIIEMSKPDSLYSPFEKISSLRLSKTRLYADLTKQLVEAYDKPTRNERRTAALVVAKLAESEYNNYEAFNDIANVLSDPTYNNKTANRRAYIVKYKVDGELKDDVFYLERNKQAIGHTASEMKDDYFELCQINSKFYSLKQDAEQAAREMF